MKVYVVCWFDAFYNYWEKVFDNFLNARKFCDDLSLQGYLACVERRYSQRFFI